MGSNPRKVSSLAILAEFGVGHGHTTILALTVLKKGYLIRIVLLPLRVTTKNWRSAKDVY